ncbi:MAG: hypothetical protein ACN6I3_00485 [bacterium]
MESFHDKLHDECLNRELFGSLAEARMRSVTSFFGSRLEQKLTFLIHEPVPPI